MATSQEVSNKHREEQRRRRAHTKSRRGCRNCKLRRVKCDESKPSCQKCQSFGVTCNYNAPNNPDLQPAWQKLSPESNAGNSCGQLVLSTEPSFSYLKPVITIGDGPGSFQLDAESVARLDRFQHRTAFTFATARMRNAFQDDVTRLAVENPFLMHIILTVTAAHDRYSSASPDTAKRSLTEAYHWSRGAALLNKKLSSPIRPHDRDALWAAAAMLGIASATSIEASTPFEAWPLKPSDPSDLNWLEMSKGKDVIWKATNPLRQDSIFHAMADEYRVLMARPLPCKIEDIPVDFIRLCRLNEHQAPQRSPYFTAVSMLAQLWHVKCTPATMTRYLKFVSFMDPNFRDLLHQKDPRALLILAYWYAPMCESLWWIARRALLECQAICMYLEKYHADELDIQRMLAVPKMQCGLLVPISSANPWTDNDETANYSLSGGSHLPKTE